MKLTIEEAQKMMEETGGSIYLGYRRDITALPENLTVGGYLDLVGTGITALPENLTVCDDIDLRGTCIRSLPDSLKVGGLIYMDGTDIKAKARLAVARLRDGEYVQGRYLYADGILTHVRGRKQIGEYTVYIGKIKGRNVVSDGKNYAHCDKLRDGIADLMYKTAKDRGAEQYKGIGLDTEMTVEEMVTMYRVITGACKQGSEDFVKRQGKLKEKYTVKEALELTKGQYGAEAFQRFF